MHVVAVGAQYGCGAHDLHRVIYRSGRARSCCASGNWPCHRGQKDTRAGIHPRNRVMARHPGRRGSRRKATSTSPIEQHVSAAAMAQPAIERWTAITFGEGSRVKGLAMRRSRYARRRDARRGSHRASHITSDQASPGHGVIRRSPVRAKPATTGTTSPRSSGASTPSASRRVERQIYGPDTLNYRVRMSDAKRGSFIPLRERRGGDGGESARRNRRRAQREHAERQSRRTRQRRLYIADMHHKPD